jgi:hypothetical protein
MIGTHADSQHATSIMEHVIIEHCTSLLKGGYLPRPGVAFAEAETISTRTRCTCY